MMQNQALKFKYVVGNWKMNLLPQQVKDFTSTLHTLTWDVSRVQAWLAPQALYLPIGLESTCLHRLHLTWGAQNTCHRTSGAYTGELSPEAVRAMGGQFTIVGHSERRQYFHEGHELLAEKIECAIKSGLKVIYCVGETLQERETQRTFDVVGNQLKQGLKLVLPHEWEQVLIAYEPVWAIGTGLTATSAQVEEAHRFIYELVQQMCAQSPPLLYGGSVNTKNFADLLKVPHVHGGLVGGASLQATTFYELLKAAQQA